MAEKTKNEQKKDILFEIAEKTDLMEGPEGVRRILTIVFENPASGSRNISRKVKIPVPVVTSVIKEMEKTGLLKCGYGNTLTEKGIDFAVKTLGLKIKEKTSETISNAVKTDNLPLLTHYAKKRGLPDTSKDQAYATSQTSIARAEIMRKNGDLEGRSVVFIGDSDLTSVACSLAGGAKELTVIDIDKKVGSIIAEFNQDIDAKGLEAQKIEFIEADFKEELPSFLKNSFDIAVTDPPYTKAGLELFVSRCVSCLKKNAGLGIYLSFGHKSFDEALEMQSAINNMGLAIESMDCGFNKYEGAGILGGVSDFIVLRTTSKAKPAITGIFKGKIYTGDVSETRRTYKCSCGKEIYVGTSEKIQSIEALKKTGCIYCGKKEGFRLAKKELR